MPGRFGVIKSWRFPALCALSAVIFFSFELAAFPRSAAAQSNAQADKRSAGSNDAIIG